MKTEKFKKLFDFAKKSKLKAGDGSEKGEYPFYTSSTLISRRTDKAQFFDESLVFGNGGTANVHYAKEPFGTTSHCYVATRKNNEINTKYVYYYLYGNLHILERGFKGAGLKNISSKYIADIDIPILPLETQNKIVDVLDRASSLVKKREQTIELLDELLRATFLDMFGDPASNSKKWNLKQITEIAKTRLGKMLDKKQITGKFLKPYLRNINIRWLNIDTEDLLMMDFNEKDMLEFKLEYEDVLMCEGGEIGRCALWENQIEECFFQKALHRIRLNKEVVLPKYFVFMFWLFADNGGLSKFKGGATFSHLTGVNLKSLAVPVPPINLQREFVKSFDKYSLIKNKFKKSYQLLDDSFNSLTQKVFNGELNFNIDFELDALVRAIDLEKKQNDLSKIGGDIAYLQRLVDKLNAQEFEEKEMYDKAKHAVFQLLKEDEIVTQEYNEKSNNVKLVLK